MCESKGIAANADEVLDLLREIKRYADNPTLEAGLPVAITERIDRLLETYSNRASEEVCNHA